MEAFGVRGTSMGTMGFIFALSAIGRTDKLEKQLKELGVLDQGAESE